VCVCVFVCVCVGCERGVASGRESRGITTEKRSPTMTFVVFVKRALQQGGEVGLVGMFVVLIPLSFKRASGKSSSKIKRPSECCLCGS